MDSSTESPVRNDIELGPVTHWPTVYAAVGIGAAVLVGLAAVVVSAALQPAPPLETPEAVAAVVPAPPPRPGRPAVKPVEVAPAVPEIVSATPEPTPAEPAMAVPAPAAMVPTAVTPIIRASDAVVVTEPTPITPTTTAPPSSRPYQGRGLEYEIDLLADLQSGTKEIDLDTVERTSAKLLGKQSLGLPSRDPLGSPRRETAIVVSPADAADHIVDLIAHRADLAGLPVSISPAVRDTAVTGKSLGHEPEPQTRKESPPRASDPALQALEEVSEELRRLQSRRNVCRKPTDSEDPDDKLSIEAQWDARVVAILAEKKDWLKDAYSPALAQMLCVEDAPVRLQLTKMLAAIKGDKASVALARQALFDLSPSVREAAVLALKDRPAEEYRQTLLDGFRHPWPPVADHAAYALTTLDDRAAAKELRAMVDLPDPAAPTRNKQKKWVKAELVKVNHLRNCLLCHAPSSSPKDPVRGFVPKLGEALPPAYYANRRRGDFVRADVTYIRQDFSVLQPVSDPGPWPQMQRFDYLVRRRPLTEQELKDQADARPAPKTYPQREAVKFALEKLTAPDGGPVDKVGLGP